MMALLVAPAPTLPVSKPPPSPVAVCAIESALCHAMVWPTLMVTGLGLYDWLPELPWIVTVTLTPIALLPLPPVAVVPPSAGDGDETPGALHEPASAPTATSATARVSRIKIIGRDLRTRQGNRRAVCPVSRQAGLTRPLTRELGVARDV